MRSSVHPQSALVGVGSSFLIPDWPAPTGVHALCTMRSGGVSAAPWNSLNLGSHVGDAPEAVAENRRRLSQAIDALTPGARPVFLNQVHGCEALRLDAQSCDGLAFDASIAHERGRVCTIMVADCLPVLLAHESGLVVGAAHAGWRGLAGLPAGAQRPQATGVVERLFARLGEALEDVTGRRQGAGQLARQTLAWLGPCIGAQAFEVGNEVRAVFMAHEEKAAQCFTASGARYLADLQALARQRLAALGIHQVYGNDGGPGWCTVSNESAFFSHRRDAARLGSSGRFAVCIWLG
ncbi:polyphenol oxidase family protein [Comamonas composti]|uniref:polyphenol oxidase family protein n=1 Tax=Comamonas composti TaxID=408558 RepID=UPI000688037E|nr:laccase domain-containing protein [Comamonas composti]